MSGWGDGQTMCGCLETHCLNGNCRCFNAKSPCSGDCKCNGCRNTENNKAEVESAYQAYLKRKGLLPSNTSSSASGSGDGQTMCSCSETHCLKGNCRCFNAKSPCSGDCKCNGCRNTENNKAEVESAYRAYLKRKGLLPSNTSSSASGSGDGQTMCSCSETHCLKGNCSCFSANLLCSGDCKCNGCRNTENNKAEVEPLYQAYFKRKKLALDYNPRVPKDDGGCGCKRSKCASLYCSCYARSYNCTTKCTCQNCANNKGLVRSDTNTEQGKGGAGGVSNVPGAAVQATPSRDNRGSDSNKRPRNM